MGVLCHLRRVDRVSSVVEIRCPMSVDRICQLCNSHCLHVYWNWKFLYMYSYFFNIGMASCKFYVEVKTTCCYQLRTSVWRQTVIEWVELIASSHFRMKMVTLLKLSMVYQLTKIIRHLQFRYQHFNLSYPWKWGNPSCKEVDACIHMMITPCSC